MIEEGEQLPAHVKNSYMMKNRMKVEVNHNSFNLEFSEQFMIDLIFTSFEFEMEIASPRSKRDYKVIMC